MVFHVRGCVCRVAVMQSDEGRWLAWVHIEDPSAAAGGKTLHVDGSFSIRDDAVEAARQLADAIVG